MVVGGGGYCWIRDLNVSKGLPLVEERRNLMESDLMQTSLGASKLGEKLPSVDEGY